METPARPTLHEDQAVEAFRRAQHLDPYRIARMRYALYRLHRTVGDSLAYLGGNAVRQASAYFDLEPLTEVQRRRSEVDGSWKCVLQARDGTRLEMVVMRARTGRTTACISSQVGCAAGCPFCATARMGLVRSLTAAEMLEQVRQAAVLAAESSWRLRNVVFMGMGEPLDNEDALYATVDHLKSPNHFAIPARRLLVSTVGVPDAMVRLVDRFPSVQIALSLHSARPDLRARLVPWSRRHSWDDLRQALRYVAERHSGRPKQGPVMIEHLLIDGVNDGPEDAEALLDYLRGMEAHVNLIPYNPIPDRHHWQATPWDRRNAFADVLRTAGYFTTIRYSMGADIAAACGQLVQASAGL